MSKSGKLCSCQAAGNYSVLMYVHHLAAHARVWAAPGQCSMSKSYFSGFILCSTVTVHTLTCPSLFSTSIQQMYLNMSVYVCTKSCNRKLYKCSFYCKAILKSTFFCCFLSITNFILKSLIEICLLIHSLSLPVKICPWEV